MVINYLAVLVAAIASMVIGGLWYSPLLFGNVWVKLSGITQKDVEKAKKKERTITKDNTRTRIRTKTFNK